MTRHDRSSARRARRAWRRGDDGYAVMVLGPDEPLFLRVGAAVGRWLFRHRSALAPFLLTGSAFVVAALIHRHHGAWWGPLTALTIVVTAALGIPHALLRRSAAGRVLADLLARLWRVCGIDRAPERAYAAVVIAVSGGWMATAIAHGPSTAPLPAIATIATMVLGIPWWVHRRRRAHARVERTIAAWPDVADTVGLTGSQIASVVVDAWGWTARVILRGGKTVGQVIDKTPAIESGFGLRLGSVRVFADEHHADRCLLRVLETDPHAAPIPWPGTSVTSISQPIPLGLFEDTSPACALLMRRNALIGGMVGSGKSGILNVILAHLVACTDVRVWGIDLKGGMELQPWSPCLDRLATTPDYASTLLADATRELDRRAALLAQLGARLWEPAPDKPALIIVIDEYAELPPEAHQYADSIARRGRAVAVTLLAATQRPTQDAMGHGAVRSQMDIRVCLRVRERRDVDVILGQGSSTTGWHAHTLTQPGTFLLSAPEHTTPHRARAHLITDHQVTRHVDAHTEDRPTTAPHPAPHAPESPQTADGSPAGVPGPGPARHRTVGGAAPCRTRRGAGPGSARRHRHDPTHPLPPPARAREGRARRADHPGSLARAWHPTPTHPTRRQPPTTPLPAGAPDPPHPTAPHTATAPRP